MGFAPLAKILISRFSSGCYCGSALTKVKGPLHTCVLLKCRLRDQSSLKNCQLVSVIITGVSCRKQKQIYLILYT